MIAEMDEITKRGNPEQKKTLNDEIEQAYLEKETKRMYERLAKAGCDTAKVSEKLTKLKKSQRKD